MSSCSERPMALELQGVCKGFGPADRRVQVLRDVTYEIPGNGIVGIVGRSGVGKSTLLNIIAGLEQPDSGQVLLGGQNITHMSEDQRAEFRARSVGFIFQFHHLLQEFTALENVMMPLLINKWNVNEARQRAHEMLRVVGLSQRETHSPYALSGGEQQRVAIARSLVSSPTYLFADEPTGNLDPETAAEIQEMLFRLQREMDMLMILVTHSYELRNQLPLVLEMQSGGELVKLSPHSRE